MQSIYEPLGLTGQTAQIRPLNSVGMEGIEPPVFTAVGVCSTGRCRRRWATLAYMEEGGVIETLCHH